MFSHTNLSRLHTFSEIITFCLYMKKINPFVSEISLKFAFWIVQPIPWVGGAFVSRLWVRKEDFLFQPSAAPRPADGSIQLVKEPSTNRPTPITRTKR